jgi:transposase-like protein
MSEELHPYSLDVALVEQLSNLFSVQVLADGPVKRMPAATRAKPETILQVQRRLPPPEILELVSRYEAGESVRGLAEAYGIHQTTVASHLERHRVARRPNVRKLSDAEVGEATQLYGSGASLDELGGRFGVSAETLRKELRAAGVPRRPPGRPRRS